MASHNRLTELRTLAKGPMRRLITGFSILALATLLAAPAWAGGAWVPKPGDGSLQLGASRKRAQSSWGRKGQILANQGDHDFRHGYDRSQRWYVEAGYNQWVWGRSARRYQEPFVSFGRGF